MPKKVIAKDTSKPKGLVEELFGEVKSAGSVYYEASVTKNLGNYESAKCSIGVTLPFYATEKEISEAKRSMNVAMEMVQEKLDEEIEKIKV